MADIRRRAWVAQVDEHSTAFIDWVSEQIDTLTLGEGSLKHYRTMLARLKEFDGIRRWNDMTVENIYKWDAWLHQLTNQQGDGPISDAAIYNYHKTLKALLNRAVLFDRIQINPYDRLKGKFKRGDRERIDYLTEDEMKAFESLHPVKGSKMAQARDLFVLQMYTGLSYSDTQAFDFSQYKKVKGKWINVAERIKTGVAYVSSLLPPAVAVLEKYGWQVPKIDNADYNHLLKVIGTMADIPTKMHTHLARHTFATYMLRQGVKVENLQRMLGHKNIRQTMRYAKVMAESVHEDFNMVAEKMMFNPKK